MSVIEYLLNTLKSLLNNLTELFNDDDDDDPPHELPVLASFKA